MANTATSIYLDGTGDYIETGVSLASYNGPFTFEGWFYPTDADRREGLFGSGTNDDFDIEFQAETGIGPTYLNGRPQTRQEQREALEEDGRMTHDEIEEWLDSLEM